MASGVLLYTLLLAIIVSNIENSALTWLLPSRFV